MRWQSASPWHWLVQFGRRLTRRRCGRSNQFDAQATHNRQLAMRYLAASEACDDLADALRRDAPVAAEHALQRVMQIDPQHPRLIELRAIEALHRVRPDEAMAMLEALPRPTARQKLLLQLVRCQADQKALAHLELAEWSHSDRCPPQARVLLAMLDMELGDFDAARAALRRNDRHTSDPVTHQMLALLGVVEDMPECVRGATSVLVHTFGHQPLVRCWLTALGLSDDDDLQHPPMEMIDQLAVELLSRPQTIAALVEAQRYEPDAGRIELLRRAIQRIVADLTDPLPAVEALAELAFMADQPDDAARWVRRGLKLSPYSAKLALLRNRLGPIADREADDGGLLSVLRRAADAHPTYPDLQQALIAQYQQQGLGHLAAQHVRQWAQKQPDHPLVRKALEDLAA